ncbi:PREDICTED: uncharacterized protein LOC109363516 [Lupinus angustifolius]|uniref:uncharacterized protein LOC109363516 n=1 Tax=Lupinus angustifolius TaxID=3871 RepID=UPI00092EBF88|nr:PREDICTED: uncharacterized protein LOC109363516 [Lupinus angustifolius]
MADFADCPRCNKLESTLHAIRDCPWVLLVWHGVPKSQIPSTFFCDNLQDWCCSNLFCSDQVLGLAEWSLVFGITIDAIWRNRNQWIFDNLRISPHHLCPKILARCRCIVKAMRQENTTFVRIFHPNSPLIRWFPREEGWVKINLDGAYSVSANLASCGRVVRDHLGAFLFAYAN